MFGTLMVFLDTTVVNLSLPYIAGSLSASINESTWSLTSYLAANAIVLPMSGWLANYIGRKRLLLGSLASFTVASLCCGLAPNIELLVLFRIVQGLTGGVMQPLSQAIMLEGFEPRDRGKAMGFWSLGIIAAPIAGPLLGGWLTQHASWRWVFLINLPIGVLAIAMVQLFVIDPPYIRRLFDRIDYSGIGFMALGIGALQVLFDRGQDEDWFDSRLITSLLVIGVVSLVLFVVRSLRIEHAVVDLRAFADPTFAVGSVLSALIGFLLYGSIVLLPLLLQTGLGYPPVEAGIIVMQRGLGSLIAFPLVGLITHRFDPRKLLAAGLALGSATMYWLSHLSPDLGARDLFWPQFIQGLALGLLFVPLTTVTMSPIPREQMGNASSLFNVTRNFGSSIGIAFLATYLQRRTAYQRQRLSELVGGFDPIVSARLDRLQDLLQTAGSDPAQAPGQAHAALGRLLDQQALLLAFFDGFRLFAWIFLLMIPLAFLMRQPDTTG